MDLIPSFSAYYNLKEIVRLLQIPSAALRRAKRSVSELRVVGVSSRYKIFHHARENIIYPRQARNKKYSNDFIRSIAHCAEPGMLCAFVLPAFEITKTFEHYVFPGSKHDLYQQFTMMQTVMIFKGKACPPGHAATNYSRWWNASIAYSAPWEDRYEPYFMVRVKSFTSEDLRKDPTQFTIPGSELLFDPRYIGYGLNKAMFIQELDAIGYVLLRIQYVL